MVPTPEKTTCAVEAPLAIWLPTAELRLDDKNFIGLTTKPSKGPKGARLCSVIGLQSGKRCFFPWSRPSLARAPHGGGEPNHWTHNGIFQAHADAAGYNVLLRQMACVGPVGHPPLVGA